MFPTLFSTYTFKVSYYLQITGFINHKKKKDNILNILF